MKVRLVILVIIAFSFMGCTHIHSELSSGNTSTDETQVALFLNNIMAGDSPNIAQLNLFFSEMPKGGDIHHHYSGSIYAETYLDWAENNNQLIDTKTLKISDHKTDTTVTVSELRSDTKLYRRLLTAWSDKDFSNHYHSQSPPDLNFFSTFGYFGHVSKSYEEGLKILKERAIKENVSYIETMIEVVGYSYPDTVFDENIRNNIGETNVFSLLNRQVSEMDKDALLQKTINDFILELEKAHKDAEIDDDQFMMRYQTYAFRCSTPSKVFSELYAAFKAAEKSDLLVGVNLVGPENSVVALADYKLQMQFFAYLRNRFPDVNVALHAGELTLGMVRPKDLKFHISQALHIGGAQRIGHGVDLPYEEDAIDLLEDIKKNAVIEINFTSNEFILGVKGQEHPYLIYSAYNIPIVICTDDSGVSRNNLSHEYVLLAARYKPSYKTIKEYAYNSIKYSFLPNTDKESLTKSLDDRFEKFESKMAKYSDQILK